MQEIKISERTMRRIKNGIKKYFPEKKVTNIKVINHDKNAIDSHWQNHGPFIITSNQPECSNFFISPERND